MTAGGLWTGRLFGATVASDRPLPGLERRPQGVGPADLEIRHAVDLPAAPADRPPLFVSADRDDDDRSLATVHRLDGGRLRIATPSGDFLVETHRILYEPASGTSGADADLAGRLEGPVLAAWLEEHRRTLVLHGSAVVVDGMAWAFLGGNGAGKSTLAAALLAAAAPAGATLATDDLLAAEPPTILPGLPRLRLDRRSFRRLADPLEAAGVLHAPAAVAAAAAEGGKTELPLAPGAASSAPAPLGALLLLGRGDGLEPRIEPVPPAARVLELLGRSYAPHLAEAAGWRERRLVQLARLVEAVPVARLILPTGLETLPAAARALLERLVRLDG